MTENRDYRDAYIVPATDAMKSLYTFLIALSFCVIVAGCICLPVEPYDPPADSQVNIQRLYDDREQSYGSALIASASFRDRYAGEVRINDDTMSMGISAVDTFNVVRYSRYVPTSYAGSVKFDGEPLRLRVQGNSAVPALDEQFTVPQRIHIASPAPTDTVSNSGFRLQWNASPGDSTYIHISGTIYLDTLVVGGGSLMLGEEFFKRSSARDYPEILLQLVRKWSIQKVLADKSTLRLYVESQTNRNLAYLNRP